MKPMERTPLPMMPQESVAELTPQTQFAYFLRKPVKVVYNNIDKSVEVTGILQQITNMAITVQTVAGTRRLIMWGTLISVEEAKVDQSLLAS